MTTPVLALMLIGVGLVVGGTVFFVRRQWPGVEAADRTSAAGVLSYVSAAFGILLGFVIVFHLGLVQTARQATGMEASSIGTAFDEAQLFPSGEQDIQHALICYSRAVTELEWDALASGSGSPAVDEAFRDLIATYGEVDEPTDRSFQPAAATNTFAQIGAISTARESRLVTAESSIGVLMWALLFGAAFFVLFLLFVVTTGARPIAQATLLGLAGLFTAVLLTLVVVLNNPYKAIGPLEPRAIEEKTQVMISLAPDAADLPCSFDQSS